MAILTFKIRYSSRRVEVLVLKFKGAASVRYPIDFVRGGANIPFGNIPMVFYNKHWVEEYQFIPTNGDIEILIST